MKIQEMSKGKALDMLKEKYGVDILIWMSCSIENSKVQVLVCDYTTLPAFTHAYQIGVYSSDGELVERLNVVR